MYYTMNESIQKVFSRLPTQLRVPLVTHSENLVLRYNIAFYKNESILRDIVSSVNVVRGLPHSGQYVSQ